MVSLVDDNTGRACADVYNGLSVMVSSQLVLKVVFILGRVYRECHLQKRG